MGHAAPRRTLVDHLLVSSSPAQLPVVLLPDGSASPELVRTLELAGARRVNALQDAAMAVIDLTQPGGEAALSALRRGPNPNSIALLAVMDEPTPERLDALDVPEFITPASLARELPARLRQADRRHRARLEVRQREKELSNLLRITADFAASLDVVTLLHDVTRRLAEEMLAEGAADLTDDPADAGQAVMDTGGPPQTAPEQDKVHNA